MISVSPVGFAVHPRPRRNLGVRRALLGALALARLVLVMALMLLTLSVLGVVGRAGRRRRRRGR